MSDAEIADLRKAVGAALKSGALPPDGLKEKLGDAVRNLGLEGLKKGLTTTLPVALGLMQAEGEIRRVPVNGRLDQQRYKYALWKPNPLAGLKATPEETLAELAGKYFGWFGPVPLESFREFAGCGVTAAKKAVAALDAVEIDGAGFLLKQDEAAFRKFQAPKKPQYCLVGSIDNLKFVREELARMEGARESNPIFDRGRLVGRWDFDTDAMEIVWAATVKDKALEEAVRRTETFVREDLGDARGFSLDSPKSRRPRIEALRKAGGMKTKK